MPKPNLQLLIPHPPHSALLEASKQGVEGPAVSQVETGKWGKKWGKKLVLVCVFLFPANCTHFNQQQIEFPQVYSAMIRTCKQSSCLSHPIFSPSPAGWGLQVSSLVGICLLAKDNPPRFSII